LLGHSPNLLVASTRSAAAIIFHTAPAHNDIRDPNAPSPRACARSWWQDPFPPISVIQFEPFFPGQLETGPNQCIIHDEEFEVNRVLIDGLARVTSVQGVRERLQVENPEAYKILDLFRFSVALYVPTETAVGPEIAGQLFTDFNSYAWPVSSAKALADDSYNPYKVIAHIVGNSDTISRHGGLKSGSPNLGRKDTHFTTELAMSQFCKIAIEGRRGYGKLTKPVSNAKISGINIEATGEQISSFFTSLEGAMGSKKFADRAQLFRTAHGMYAIAVIFNDISEKRTNIEDVIKGLASINWTWSNKLFRQHIGHDTGDGVYKLNTGMATLDWLIACCRRACNVMLTTVA
jgi:hypothetical protein